MIILISNVIKRMSYDQFKTRLSTFRAPDRDIERVKFWIEEAILMSTGPNLVTICALIKFI